MCYVCFDSHSEENALDSRCSRSRAGSSDGDEDIIVNSEIIMSGIGGIVPPPFGSGCRCSLLYVHSSLLFSSLLAPLFLTLSLLFSSLEVHIVPAAIPLIHAIVAFVC